MPSREPLCAEDRATLLRVARESIEHGFARGTPLTVATADYSPALQRVEASFVTLTIEGRLRGCIGSLEARLPLVEDVALHGFDAAFRDRRFEPLTPQEHPRVHLHISVLTPAEPVIFADETDLLSQLRPGHDGLIIAQGPRRATFLPTVWEGLPEPARFLSHLKMKAGITGPPTPAEPLRAWRYHTEGFGETA
jgi:hypothetical protein